MGRQDFVSKNPSTAAASHMPGGRGGYQALTSGGGIGIGQIPHESFDLEFMMPPDVADIEQDISNPYSL